jgi:hypothetical protein
MLIILFSDELGQQQDDIWPGLGEAMGEELLLWRLMEAAQVPLSSLLPFLLSSGLVKSSGLTLMNSVSLLNSVKSIGAVYTHIQSLAVQ